MASSVTFALEADIPGVDTDIDGQALAANMEDQPKLS